MLCNGMVGNERILNDGPEVFEVAIVVDWIQFLDCIWA